MEAKLRFEYKITKEDSLDYDFKMDQFEDWIDECEVGIFSRDDLKYYLKDYLYAVEVDHLVNGYLEYSNLLDVNNLVELIDHFSYLIKEEEEMQLNDCCRNAEENNQNYCPDCGTKIEN